MRVSGSAARMRSTSMRTKDERGSRPGGRGQEWAERREERAKSGERRAEQRVESSVTVLIEKLHHVCLAGAHTACRENGPRLRGRADRATPLLLPPRQHLPQPLQHAAASRRGMLSTANSAVAEHSPDDGVLLLLATQRVVNVPRVVEPRT